jgi:hypothetical protein
MLPLAKNVDEKLRSSCYPAKVSTTAVSKLAFEKLLS